MPANHSPSDKSTRSQRTPVFLTSTTRIPFDCTPSAQQLSENLDRGPPMEGAASSRRGGMKSIRSRSFSGLFEGYPGISEVSRGRLVEVEDEEGESLEEQDYRQTEVEDSFSDSSEVPQGFNLAFFDKPPVSQTEPSLLMMMKQMTRFMGKPTKEFFQG
ncbi:hypothetical protein O181_008990 [Austropuccinia psidii MF-1]|uniref:Uncharacterized protein n=1 Tax=Austropuccinia psidii MF-1 TaxID=1389203 RepID=A0A9Q3BR05_9BASI|nr:hypothetical protein [Austropuccinia psidii MF-1]